MEAGQRAFYFKTILTPAVARIFWAWMTLGKQLASNYQ